MPRKTKSDAELQAAAGSMVYVRFALGDAYRLYVLARPAEGKPSAIAKIAIESFLIHCRNIRDFLLGTSIKDDIAATDFFPSPSEPFNVPKAVALKDDINKLLAHPSYERPALIKQLPAWEIGAMYDELSHMWEVFVGRLSPERRAWFVG